MLLFIIEKRLRKMKKFEPKKLILLVIIVLVIGALVFFVVTRNNKPMKGKKVTGDAYDKVSAYVSRYVLGLTEGTDSLYNGIEALYNSDDDEVSIDDIETIKLVVKAEGETESQDDRYTLESNNYNLSDYIIAYDADSVEKNLKEIYGREIDIETSNELKGYRYAYDYIKETNTVLLKETDAKLNGEFNMSFKISDITEDKENTYVKVYVAYVAKADNKIQYFSDMNTKNKVYDTTSNNIEAIKDDYLEKFDSYIITLKNTDDGYNFTKIAKEK
jgi:copper chaperone CopZ